MLLFASVNPSSRYDTITLRDAMERKGSVFGVKDAISLFFLGSLSDNNDERHGVGDGLRSFDLLTLSFTFPFTSSTLYMEKIVRTHGEIPVVK